MRVTRQQAEENRQTVIDVASRLFRQHGFDGIGLKDLMAGAGLTQGAFYKQFESKDDLAAQASRRALESASGRWSAAARSNPEDPLSAVVDFYLSMGHCAEKSDGCPIVALGSDAARQGPDVKAAFQAGIEDHLEMLGGWVGNAEDAAADGRAMAVLSTMVGAVLLSRAVNDEHMSKRLLQAAAESVLAQLPAGEARSGPRQ
ncbi:TetR family transcriptional regulator [Bosea sp. Tri-44]|uniref:TetR/AcrR family transcriptional regulator n=1 Tax=Bosea sp. Tri-44 TaxID=1972137 RepID=UPI00100DEB9F|nr:TetR family transcriptional regulator [Bosea sp. Tri-44]RXT57415.1 TetR family transcriptional regulator [Bosea sp. Tri-44]